MLISVSADKESFKTVNFRKGFNVILADREPASSKKETRNGTGKSSLIEIIHFCLGGMPKTALNKEELSGWTFSLELKIKGKRYKFSRNTSKEKNKVVIEGDCSEWEIKPELNGHVQTMLVEKLNKMLGKLFFGMKTSFSENYAPSFRSCISYYARRNGTMGGYISPFSRFKDQQEWDVQVSNSFMLGLDWKLASEWRLLKDRKTDLRNLRKSADTGMLANFYGHLGKLESDKVLLEDKIKTQKEELESFKVHPQYRQIEEKADALTKQIQEFSNNNISDQDLLRHYKKNLKEEKRGRR